jgi:hypothetical protein
MRYQFNPERLAYWYLRLNGFLPIENFIVHDEGGRAQRTDIDLWRFAFHIAGRRFVSTAKMPIGWLMIRVLLTRTFLSRRLLQ